jgi:prepilin-type N-terminal cleavage/methylation domain-containing protein/prepilin-type processing-associated H-X9-DG protein
MLARHTRAGFTLIELLVAIAIVALLAALLIPQTQRIREYGWRSGCLSHMRQVGIALRLYANENEGQLPGRPKGKDPLTGLPYDRWPMVLSSYVTDYRVYVDPGDPKARAVPPSDLMSNFGNHTSFFFNGFNDMGAFTDGSIQVRLQAMEQPSQVIMLGQKKYTSAQYYMDFEEPPHGNQNDVLNKTAYAGGSNYVFADGSARFLKLSDYSDTMWLVNKQYAIPVLP